MILIFIFLVYYHKLCRRAKEVSLLSAYWYSSPCFHFLPSMLHYQLCWSFYNYIKMTYSNMLSWRTGTERHVSFVCALMTSMSTENTKITQFIHPSVLMCNCLLDIIYMGEWPWVNCATYRIWHYIIFCCWHVSVFNENQITSSLTLFVKGVTALAVFRRHMSRNRRWVI